MKNLKYSEMIGILESLKAGTLINSKEEKELVNDLSFIIKKNKVNKLSEYIVENNVKINELLQTINEKLKYYIEGDGAFPPTTKREITIDNLNRLKEDVISFKRSLYKPSNYSEKELIDICLNTLSEDNIPSYFNEPIVTITKNKNQKKEYDLNKDLINKLYELSLNDKLISDLETGTRLITSKEKYENNVGKCSVTLSFKDLVLNNKEQIIKYNSIVKEIEKTLEERNNNRFIGVSQKEQKNREEIFNLESNSIRRIVNKNKLKDLYEKELLLLELRKELDEIDNKLKELHIELAKTNIELKEKGLTDLITRSDLKYLLNKEEDPLAITSNLRSFYNEDDINSYFINVEKEYKTNKKLLDKLYIEEKEFNNNVCEEAKELIINDFNNAEKLGNLNKIDTINPKIVLFTLNALILSKETELKDLIITEAEYLKYKTLLDGIINNQIVEFDEKYIKALENPKRHR